MLERFLPIVNHALMQDPVAIQLLPKLNKTTFRIQINQGNLCQLQWHESGLSSIVLDQNADVAVEGPLIAYLHLVMTKQIQEAVQLGLQFSGDAALLEIYQQMLSQFRFNWEEMLSPHLGDVLTHTLSSTLSKFSQFRQHAKRSLFTNLAEYWQEESRILPTPIEIQHHCQAVDELRLQVDRLEQKVLQLTG